MLAPRQGEVIQFSIPSNRRYVSTVRWAVLSLARSLSFPEEIAEDIHLSVAEAITNAVEHGSPSQMENVILVVCKIAGDKLIIDVWDEGTGFRMPESIKCTASLDEHGRGLILISKLMDRVRVRNTTKGSLIRMTKRNPCYVNVPISTA